MSKKTVIRYFALELVLELDGSVTTIYQGMSQIEYKQSLCLLNLSHDAKRVRVRKSGGEMHKKRDYWQSQRV